MTKLTFPFTEKNSGAESRREVLISGIVFTGRDAVGLASVCQQQ
ncbi:MAG: hypothetical protein ACLPRE_11665 [Limisphaerales bacterium]